MRRKRFTILLFLLLPVAIWGLSGWNPGTTSVFFPPDSTQPHDPDPFVQGILNQVNQAEFSDVDSGLSGVHPITIGGQQVTLTTRYTPSTQGTLAEQYVYEYFQSLGYAPRYQAWSACSLTGRNIIAEIPGTVDPSRIYLLTGHLDSISPNPGTDARGADDNGSGTTAVMLAARILHNYSFDYTVRFVAFTGEERGLCGSNYYANQSRINNENIQGVINLDMIAYDSNSVKDVEIHAGTRSDSQAIANQFIQNISTYNLNLVPHLLTTSATNRSDHASFWTYNYPAFLGIEYFFGGDGNPFYHSYTCCDTMSHTDLGMAVDMTKAALATISQLGAVRPGGSTTPTPTSTPTECCNGYAVLDAGGMCIPTMGYNYFFDILNGCNSPSTGTFTMTLQVSPNQGGPWTDYHVVPPFTQTLQVGATSVVGNAGWYNIPVPYNYFRFHMEAEGTDGCWTLRADTVGEAVCREATPAFTPTSTYTPAITVGPTHSPTSTPTASSTDTPVPTTPVPTNEATETPTAPPSTATTVPCDANFSDVSTTDYFYNAVRYLACEGAISGYSDGTFRPYNNTTRGQLAKIVVLAEGWQVDCPSYQDFSDVPPSNPFFCYIELAFQHGIISGYSDGTFRWGNNVTRGQLTKVVVLAEQWPIDTHGAPHFSDVPSSDPFYSQIETAYNRGIISGYADGTFRPGSSSTRGQISKIIYGAVTSGSPSK